MKQTIVLLAALACVAAAYLSGHSQQPRTVPVLAATKVGAVNMGAVYVKYERVKAFKAEMERDAEPFKKKKAELDATAAEWVAIAMSADEGVSRETREMARSIVLESRRQLEDLDAEFKREFSKKLENQMTVLNAQVREGINAYSAAHGYHLIIAYGQPEVSLPPLQEFRRTMMVIDSGGSTLAYVSPAVDVSDELVRSLNSQFRAEDAGDDE